MKVIAAFATYSIWCLALTRHMAMEMPHMKEGLFFVLVVMLIAGFTLAHFVQMRESLEVQG